MTQPRATPAPRPSRLRQFWNDNALSLAPLGLFLLFWVAQALSGWAVHNEELRQLGQRPLDLPGYLSSSHFWSSTAENWESEFLQMGLYVALTVWFRQRGSAESNPYPDEQPEAQKPPTPPADSPWPVRRGGLALTLYRNSLSLVMLLLFAAVLALHLLSSARAYNQEQLARGEVALSLLSYLGHPDFWFQSFQNWQSEFLAVASLVVLSIWLRQTGSSQSKAVEAPHAQTGD